MKLILLSTKCLHILFFFLLLVLASDGNTHQNNTNQTFTNKTFANQSYPTKVHSNETFTHQNYTNHTFKNKTFTHQIYPNKVYPNQTLTRTNEVKNNSSKGVYICITGQLARLELKNKIERLLLPLHSLGFDLYIALALHNSTQHFSNNNNGDKMSLVPSLDHAMSVLRGVKGVKEVMHFPLKHPENMHVNKKYLKTLDNKQTEPRVQNHARQYHSLQFCNQWPLIRNLTQVSVRVREDILFEHSNISEIVSLVKKGKIVTPLCEEFKGINDKVAFLPSSHARTFFHYPYERYHTYNGKIRKLNSEQFYKFVYKEKGLPLQSSSSLYVAKAVTKLVGSMSGNESSLCEVVTNGHNVCDSGCARALFNETEMKRNITYCRVVKLNNSDAVEYKSSCW